MMKRPVPMGEPTPRLTHIRGSQPRRATSSGGGPDRHTSSPLDRQRYGLDDADPQFLAIVRGDLIDPDDGTAP